MMHKKDNEKQNFVDYILSYKSTLEGGGVEDLRKGIEWLASAFSRYYPNDLPLPTVSPYFPEGFIFTYSGDIKASFLVYITRQVGCWNAVNTKTDKAYSRDIDLYTTKGWEKFNNEVYAIYEEIKEHKIASLKRKLQSAEAWQRAAAEAMVKLKEEIRVAQYVGEQNEKS